MPHHHSSMLHGLPVFPLRSRSPERNQKFNPLMNIIIISSGLTLDNIMTFCVVALGHTSADVRMVAENIVKGQC